MGLNCNRHCINQVESVCYECDYTHATICELCGQVKHTSECWCEVTGDHDLPNNVFDGTCDEDRMDLNDEHFNDHPQANEARAAMTKAELTKLTNYEDSEVRRLAMHILSHRHDDRSDEQHLEQT